jgi:DNA-binding winged helix-turn-helix (wHTH) protein/tetratricopeptide (TPR) repeat protein
MPASERYAFGEFRLDATERQLLRDGRAIALEPKAHDVLVALVRHAGRLVTKRELLDLVWPDAFVGDGILTVHISNLRKALGDGAYRREYIETVPRSGYRFVGVVTKQEPDRHEASERGSLAVLPARPLTTEILSERDRNLGLAISDTLIDRLGVIKDLVVRPTRAVHTHTQGGEDPAVVGRSLRVDAVVDSMFIRTGDRLELSVRLLRAQDGSVSWSWRFDQPVADVTAIGDVVAAAVATHFGVSAMSAQAHGVPDRNGRARLTPRSSSRPEVYELIGQGRSHLLAASMFEVPKAVAAFRAAIELDPTYAAAYAGLALACCAQADFRVAPVAESYSEAKAAALRALAMNDTCADAQVALGAVLYLSEWNWIGAANSLERALELNPNHSEAYLLYGRLMETLSRLNRGLEMKQRALERDPFSPLVHLQISLSYWNQHRYDDAIEWANKTLELDQRHPHAREHLAAAYLKKGETDRWMAENIRHAELHGAPPEALEPVKRAYAAGGRAGVVAFVLEHAGKLENPSALMLAVHYGEAGRLDSAFEHLERALDSHDPAMVHLAVAPQWDSLRADPRFNQCLVRGPGAVGYAAARFVRWTKVERVEHEPY